MYNKLFTKILDSTVWLEPDATRLVWITMLAAMDEDGFVALSSVGNVAARARVSLEDAQKAVAALEADDRHDPGQEHGGRRIERVPYGWMVVNASKYRDIVARETARASNRERVRMHRARNASVTHGNAVSPNVTHGNAVSPNVTHGNAVSPNVTQSEAVSEALYKPIVGLKPDDARSLKAGRVRHAIEILAFLNEKAGKHFQPVKQNVDLIVGLLASGSTPEDIRAVVAKKVREWKGSPDMERYLRPATLFGPKNFHSKYRGEIPPE
jgi:uncharacterized phage protein (TIGR02220 family)